MPIVCSRTMSGWPSNPTPQVKQRRDFFPFGEEIPADSSHGNRHVVLDNGVATYNFSLGVTQ